jgi:hypothetical protein
VGNASYFSVRCRSCNRPIPLIEFRGEFHYRLPDSFAAAHKTQNPSCEITRVYTYLDVDRQDLERIPDFRPHPDFEQLKSKG